MEQNKAAGLIMMSSWYEELETRKATLAEETGAYNDAAAQRDQYYSDIAG